MSSAILGIDYATEFSEQIVTSIFPCIYVRHNRMKISVVIHFLVVLTVCYFLLRQSFLGSVGRNKVYVLSISLFVPFNATAAVWINGWDFLRTKFHKWYFVIAFAILQFVSPQNCSGLQTLWLLVFGTTLIHFKFRVFINWFIKLKIIYFKKN